jgi:GDPmannose 4,6-dehydratase
LKPALSISVCGVRDFVNSTFEYIGKTIRWQGEGVDEKGYDDKTGQCIIEVDPQYFRPTEVDTLFGDPTKAKENLGWEAKVTLKKMVAGMIEADLQAAKRDALVIEHGFKAV